MLQVAIIGGGLAGPVLALCLQKKSISVEIYESRDEYYTHGGNIALAPNALRVLDRLGAYENLRCQGFSYEELAFNNGSGVELGRFLNGGKNLYNFPALRIHRALVREELIRLLNKEGIPIHWNKKCAEVVEEKGATEDTEGSATVKFASGETVTARFVIAADGIHSRLRSFVVPEAAAPSFSGLMGIMGTVMASELGDLVGKHGLHLPAMLFGANGSFAIMPASFDGKEIGYFATIEGNDRGREGWSKLGENGDEMKSMLEDRFLKHPDHQWPELVKQLCNKTPTDTLTSWPFYSVPHLNSWTSAQKRVILIGDAAHAIPPTGGQGAAMAFEDADTLSYVLACAFSPDLDQSKSLRELFTKWEHHRLERIAKVIDFTTKNGKLRKSSPHVYEQAAKEWLIWAALKWMGPEGGAKWMYSYCAESVLAAIS